jgi:hypothetical protein
MLLALASYASAAAENGSCKGTADLPGLIEGGRSGSPEW